MTRAALIIGRANLRRMVRYRPNIFFMLLFPMLLILVIGAAFGGGFTPRLGVVAAEPAGPLAERLVTALSAADGVDVARYDDEEEMRTAVERGELAGGLVVPAGFDAAVAGGDRADLPYHARPDELGQQVAIAVQGAVAGYEADLRAARFAADETGGSFDDGLATVDRIAAGLPPVTVATSTVGDAEFPESLGRFDVGASSMLLLFVFLSSLMGATAMIETRQLGVTRRMRASPASVATILTGESLGRLGIALAQSAIILVGGALLFGVAWGDPLGAAALVLVFSLVASGAAMVVGSALRNEQQSVAVGLMLGLGMAALGGSMVPLELFPDSVRTVAFATPHAWGNEAFAELVRRGGGVADIAPQLGVLAGYAVVLFVLGGWLLRRTLAR